MSHNDFNHLLNSLATATLSPEQMERLYRELDNKRAAASAVAQPAASEKAAETARKPIWERILERSAAIPDEEWDKLPTDLAEQHDHYIYGTPKRPTT
jgi:hypothetical protein